MVGSIVSLDHRYFLHLPLSLSSLLSHLEPVRQRVEPLHGRSELARRGVAAALAKHDEFSGEERELFFSSFQGKISFSARERVSERAKKKKSTRREQA